MLKSSFHTYMLRTLTISSHLQIPNIFFEIFIFIFLNMIFVFCRKYLNHDARIEREI